MPGSFMNHSVYEFEKKNSVLNTCITFFKTIGVFLHV